MLLTPHASGSGGNLYEVSDGQTRLLLECGLPYRALRARLKRPLCEYAACLMTHEHQDHARAARELLERGCLLAASEGTFAALGLSGPLLRRARPGCQTRFGTLLVKPFAADHDGAEPLGYLIHSTVTGERLCFATDTANMRYRFPKLTEIAIECNYDFSLRAGKLPEAVVRRIRRTHMSLEKALVWLSQSDLSGVKRIWLLHLSAEHASAAGYREAVERATGIPAAVCKEREE